jgi:hypothetical protein
VSTQLQLKINNNNNNNNNKEPSCVPAVHQKLDNVQRYNGTMHQFLIQNLIEMLAVVNERKMKKE